MLKTIWKNSFEFLLLSPLMKHQTILHLHVENTTFPNYSQMFLTKKIKIENQHIHTKVQGGNY